MELAAKLQLKSDQGVEALLAPESLTTAFEGLTQTTMDRDPALVVFVVDRATLEKQRQRIVSAVKAERLTWVAYPKGGQLGTDLNRDTLASLLTTSGIQPVRQIALDEVWSALRFRPGS